MDAIAAETGEEVFLPMIKRMNGVFDRSNQNDRDFYRGVVGLQAAISPTTGTGTRTTTEPDEGSDRSPRPRCAIATSTRSTRSPDPATGQPVCRDAAARAAGCAPFNPFGFNSVSR